MSRLAHASRRLNLEALEDRTLLSTCHVTRLTDQGIGKGFRGDLRYCINKVNSEPGPDAIDFTVTGTINLTSALPDLASDVDIQGPGASLVTIRRDTSSDYRIFTVLAGTVGIRGLMLGNGREHLGGAIYNEGNLTIEEVVVTNSISTDGYGGSIDLGGGIYSAGTLIIFDSLVAGNQAKYGGGIYNAGTATVIGSTISNNVATYTANSSEGFGGGIYNAGTLAIMSSTISDNVAKDGSLLVVEASGGGILNDGMMWVDSSAIVNNHAISIWDYAEGHGGGICNLIHGTATIRNSTIANNSAGYGGGGIASFGQQFSIDHSTIAGNHARVAGGVLNDKDFAVELRNTITASNAASESELGPDVVGQFTSQGYNLIGNSNQSGGFTSTDLLDVDPLLGPLTDNGGPTLTMALLPGSPAIDAGDNTDAPDFDQRGPGFPRIVNGAIDIGAFEVQATGAPGTSNNLAVLLTADFDAFDR